MKVHVDIISVLGLISYPLPRAILLLTEQEHRYLQNSSHCNEFNLWSPFTISPDSPTVCCTGFTIEMVLNKQLFHSTKSARNVRTWGWYFCFPHRIFEIALYRQLPSVAIKSNFRAAFFSSSCVAMYSGVRGGCVRSGCFHRFPCILMSNKIAAILIWKATSSVS